MLVRELEDGAEIDQVLLCREVEARQKRDGGEFLKLVLCDRTGSVPAMVWDGVAQFRDLCVAGTPIRIIGRYAISARYGAQVTVRAVRQAVPGTFDLNDLLDGPPRAPQQMEADLRELVGTVQNPFLSALLERFFGEATPTWGQYRTAPAAKFFHQAYRHGLLEHCLSVAQAVGAISATFPGVDRDVAVTGALLHDIGKLEAYTDAETSLAIDLTDDGRLQGEIPLGYYRVRREIEEIEGFPRQLARAVLHIILSHHGSLAHGSPVVPCTREATLVHMIDNLGGRLGSFDRLEKELPAGAEWSGFDRAIGAGAWFGLQQALTAVTAQPAGDSAQPGTFGAQSAAEIAPQATFATQPAVETAQQMAFGAQPASDAPPPPADTEQQAA